MKWIKQLIYRFKSPFTKGERVKIHDPGASIHNRLGTIDSVDWNGTDWFYTVAVDTDDGKCVDVQPLMPWELVKV
jgi:hypothetical protein